MKTKYLNKKSWRRIKKSDYKEVLTNYKGQQFLIGCFFIKSVNKPLVVTIVNENVKVVDNNYKWITMMGEDENFSLTVMFDDRDRPIQYYFDINKSHSLELGAARREDMYLDVLALPDGRTEIVDEEDVVRALKQGAMTEEDREFAYKVAEDVTRLIKDDFDEVVNRGKFMYETIMERKR